MHLDKEKDFDYKMYGNNLQLVLCYVKDIGDRKDLHRI